jgi:hypothetical protein
MAEQLTAEVGVSTMVGTTRAGVEVRGVCVSDVQAPRMKIAILKQKIRGYFFMKILAAGHILKITVTLQA